MFDKINILYRDENVLQTFYIELCNFIINLFKIY